MEWGSERVGAHVRDPGMARDTFRGALAGGAVGESTAMLAPRTGHRPLIRYVTTADDESPRVPSGAHRVSRLVLDGYLSHVGDVDAEDPRAAIARHCERAPRRASVA